MDYKKAAAHWDEKDKNNKNVPKETLQTAADAYLASHNTCALATGTGSFIRCTPIEYTYHDHALWMFSEGGKKFIGLEQNKNVCLAIYDTYDGFGNLKGMQITGTATVVEPFSDDYVHAAAYKKIPLEALKKLPEPMHVIKITPNEIDFLNSDFKKDGYSSRQKLIYSEIV